MNYHSDRTDHTRTRPRADHAAPASRSNATTPRGRRLIGEILRGSAFFGMGALLGSCPLLFGTVPLGISLIAASSAYTWWIAGGAVLGAFLSPQDLDPWAFVGIYAFLLILRLCIRLFVDPPAQADGRPMGASSYLALCRDSFFRNLGLAAKDEQEDGGQAPAVDARPSETQLFGEHPFLRMLTATVVGFAAGLVGMIAGGFHMYDLFGTLFLLLACPVFTFFLVSAFGEGGLTLLFSPTPLTDMPPLARTRKGRSASGTRRRDGMSELLARYEGLQLISTLFLCGLAVYAARGFRSLLSFAYIQIELSLLLALLFSLFTTARMGVVAGLSMGVVTGLCVSPRLAPILIVAVGGYALLQVLSTRAGLLGGCTLGAIWCTAVEGMETLTLHLPAILLSLPAYLLVERAAEAFPLSDSPAHTDRELEGFTASVSAALAAENRAEAQRARLFALSEALASLSKRFSELSGQLKKPRQTELRRICDEALTGQCARCRVRDSCRLYEQDRLRDIRNALANALEREGHIQDRVASSVLSSECVHAEEILEDINRRYAHLREELDRGERSDVYASDYAAMAALLGDALEADRIEAETMGGNRETADRIYEHLCERGLTVHGVVVTGREESGRRRVIIQGRDLPYESSEIESIRTLLEDICHTSLSTPVVESGTCGDTVLTFSPRARLRAAFAGSTVPAEQEHGAPLPSPLTHKTPAGGYAPPAVCGDHIALFHSGEAYFYALISDGMGSGEEASMTSDICVSFLEKMLSAGGSAELSLRMLDGYLHAKNAGTGGECSATVDLMELDLMDGHAVFAKNGAAPTYVVRDGTVYKLRSRSLPLGIMRDTPTEFLRFRTDPGDVVVMVSDGVTRGQEECPWLIDLLASSSPRSMDELRRDIIRRALSAGSEDDLSAIAIRVENERVG